MKTFIFKNIITSETKYINALTERQAWTILRQLIKGPNTDWELQSE